MRPRRIAYYLVTSGFGGVELAVLAILRQLDREAFEPVMYFRCTNPDADARMREELARLRVPVRELNEDGLPLPSEKHGTGSRFSPGLVKETGTRSQFSLRRLARVLTPSAMRSAWYSWRAVRATARVFRREAFDVIHFLHGWYPSLELPLIASRVAGIPLRLSDVHLEPERAWPARLFHRILIRLAARSATRVRALYPRMRDQLAEWFHISAARIAVVPIGIAFERFAAVNGGSAFKASMGFPPTSRVVTVPARLSKEKGHRVLLQAIARLRAGWPDVRYLLVGDGPLREELQRHAAAQRLDDRVVFLGFRSDMPAIFSASDVVALPSFKEGLPWVLLEAMAAGKPIVATDVGGVGELFRQGGVGRLIEPGSPEQLSQAIEDLLATDDVALRRMGDDARAVVQRHYTDERTVQQVIALYGTGGGRR